MAATKRLPTMRPTAATAPRTRTAAPAAAVRSGFARGNAAMATLFRSAKDGSCSACEDRLHRKAGSGREPGEVPPIVYDVLRSSGQPLPAGVRTDMEARFGGADFSGVRVHTDARAAESAEAVNAKAYTVGQHIAFGGGRGGADRELLAHELTHTLQSPMWSGSGTDLSVAPATSAHEQAADATARRVVSGAAPVAPVAARPVGGLHRRVGDQTQLPPDLACPVATDLPSNPVVNVQFGHESSALGQSVADQVKVFLTSWRALGSPTPVRVDGFASTDGPEGLNWKLSCERAQAVVAELMYPSGGPYIGVPEGAVTPFAQGETDEFSRTELPPNRVVTISVPAAAPTNPQPPEPQPSAPACSVDVRATHIGGALSVAPIWHLFVIYKDAAGTEFFFRGGPGNTCVAGGHGGIQDTHGRYVPGTVDWDTSAPSVTVMTGSAACGKDTCLAAELSRIHGGCTPYQALGPNSNTVARTLLANCGIPQDKPVMIAPGWTDPTL